MNRLLRFRAACVAVVIGAAVTMSTVSADSRVRRLVVFGDSLSDSGGVPAPTPPYFEGRWSDGLTYADDLAPLFGLGPSLRPSSLSGGTNFARAGARIAGTNGVVEQIAAYLQSVGWRADRHDAHIVFIGGNDLRDGLQAAFANPGFDPSGFVDRQVLTLQLALNGLSSAGARNLFVLNLPDLSKLPGLPPPAAPLAAFMSARFNADLDGVLRQLSRGDGKASLVDVSAFFRDIMADAAAGGPRFGIVHTTEPCLVTSGVVLVSLCTNPEQYLFWDPIHPTGRVHQLLADFVFETIDRRGRD